jgi:hypothetical protein
MADHPDGGLIMLHLAGLRLASCPEDAPDAPGLKRC